MTNYEWASLIVSGLGAIFVGITLIYTSRQLIAFKKSHVDNHDWYRRSETQKAIDKIRYLELAKLNQAFGFMDRREVIPNVDILAAFENDRELEDQCVLLLNSYEGLAAGIKLGIYEEKIIKVNRKGNMKRTYQKFSEYIKYRRDMTDTTTYQEFEYLLEKWKEEEKKLDEMKQIGKI